MENNEHIGEYRHIPAEGEESKRKAGRPRVIDPAVVAALRQSPERFTWKEIAAKLGVSEASVIRVFRPFRRKEK